MKKFVHNLGKAVARLSPGSPKNASHHGEEKSCEDNEVVIDEQISMKNNPTLIYDPMSTGEDVNDETLLRRVAIRNNPAEFDSDAMDESLNQFSPILKSQETIQILYTSLKEHFLMSQLSDTDMMKCIDLMIKQEYKPGEDLITQGDEGTDFFVLESGQAVAIINNLPVANYGESSSFGELALMYNCKRAATVRATDPCVAWKVGMKIFRAFLSSSAMNQIVTRCDFLKRVEILKPLTNEQRTKVADALEVVIFQKGEYIIRQGEQGESFYIVEDGAVECTQFKNTNDTTETSLMTFRKGDYFGEMALMLEEPRSANCIAVSDSVTCLMLDRTKFFNLLGPLQEVLQKNMRLRILRGVPLLAKLTDTELMKVANSLTVQSFEDGDYVIQQGENGTKFYIINEGEVRCTLRTPGVGEEKEIMKLQKGEYFGERALLKNEPRGANVIAKGYVDCLVLERDDFVRLLGPLETILQREILRREAVGEEIVGEPIIRKKHDYVPLEELNRIGLLGMGTFGRVQLVEHQVNGKLYALKSMMKAQIAKSHQQRNIMNEKNILMQCDHPMIMDLVCTYNTRDELLMLTELMLGGELWSYMYEKKKMKLIPHTHFGGYTTESSQFYCGIVVLCFQYLHQMHVAYRDLKPENLLVMDNGYIKMIDFGFAKRIPFRKGSVLQTKSFTLCGTPDYLSPELILSKGHDKSVDYWALGIFIYELLIGKTPFTDTHQQNIFKKAIRSDRFLQFPVGFPKSAEDLIRNLINPNPSFRLGNMSHGVKDIMTHRWFTENEFDWDKLFKQTIIPPFKPITSNPRGAIRSSGELKMTSYHGPQNIFEGF